MQSVRYGICSSADRADKPMARERNGRRRDRSDKSCPIPCKRVTLNRVVRHIAMGDIGEFDDTGIPMGDFSDGKYGDAGLCD